MARSFHLHRLLITGPLLVVALAACTERNASTGATSAGNPVQGGTLVIAGSAELGGMNAFTASESYTQDFMLHALFLALVRLDQEGNYQPLLARSWSWEGDSAIAFQLRNDVKWHDGRKTSAYDVAFTFDRVKDAATAFPNAADFQFWKTVTVADSFTVRFTLEPQVEPLLSWVFMPIMPKHLLESVAPAQLAQAPFNHQPVGNGPFRFVEYRANDRWVFEANPDFPAELGGRPHVDQVVWRTVPENTAQVTELLTGNVDLILAPRADDITRLESQAGVHPIVKRSRQYHFIGWNGKRPPFDDARVRKALTLALDRGQILRVLRGGRGELAAGPIAPFHWAYPDTVKPLPFDVAAAKALLAEAGLRDADGDGTLQLPNGKPFKLELKIQANNMFNLDVAQMVQSDLAAVGVGVTIKPTEFGTLIDDISSPSRNFDAVLMGWEADFRINLTDTFHSSAIGGPFQLASYRNSELDALLDELGHARDRAVATPRWHRVQWILREEQPWTFMYYVPSLYAVRDRVRGIDMDVRGTFVNLSGWWLTDARPATRPAHAGAK